jgi:DNA invertase Pin-like site-specific DNA recombinase
VDQVVLKQGIDTTTPADRFLFHVIGAKDEMRYTVAEIAEIFHVSRKTIYRHLGPTTGATEIRQKRLMVSTPTRPHASIADPRTKVTDE